ncbi:uncharacterized protein BJX67DRAFT_351874 [Aspergillus lucknowensis]|uniref:Secreted protein n=1 Tax=Aspergillus lucknowensis TaxID=176173 RepID=A0ABR4LTX9_9EURO
MNWLSDSLIFIIPILFQSSSCHCLFFPVHWKSGPLSTTPTRPSSQVHLFPPPSASPSLFATLVISYLLSSSPSYSRASAFA